MKSRQPLVVVPVALGGYEAWECPWPEWAQRPKDALVFSDKAALMKFMEKHFEEWKFHADGDHGGHA